MSSPIKIRLLLTLLILLVNNLPSFAQANNVREEWATQSECSDDTCLVNYLNSVYPDIRYMNLDSAFEMVDYALFLAKKNKYSYGLIKSFFNKGDALGFYGKFSDALANLDSAMGLCTNTADELMIAEIYNLSGIMYSDQGLFDKSFEKYNMALEIAKKNNFESLMSKAYANIGVSHYKSGDYGKAIENYLITLRIQERINDSARITVTLANLAAFYQMKQQYDKAIAMNQKSLTYIGENDYYNKANVFNNIAIIHVYQEEYDEAVEYLNKSLSLQELMGDERGIAYTYNTMGDIYRQQKNYELAISSALKAVELARKNGYKVEEAGYLRSVGIYCFSNKEYKRALSYAESSIVLARQLAIRNTIRDNYHLLADIHRNLGNFKTAVEYMFSYQAINDSIIIEEYESNIAEMETKYESEKKELQIEALEKETALQISELALKDSDIKKKAAQRNGLIGGIALLIVLVFVATRSFIRKKQDNKRLAEKNDEILLQKEEIEAQRDEIEAQRDLVMLQKEHIEHVNKEITDSIQYAKRIQGAIFPSPELAEEILGEHFIFFRPKDIVSGDFYWATMVNNWLIWTVADCTGHGVPGAFMSMLGIAFLNEIVRKEEVTQANHVLNDLRRNVIYALQQKGISGEQKDGMDMALCVVNTKTNELQYAGANNPLYIINTDRILRADRNKEEDSTAVNSRKPVESPHLLELKGDKMPIAIHIKMDKFTNNELQLTKGDCLYMFSDGYPDQFGGEKGRKFKYRPFKELLIKNSKLSMAAQHHELDIHLSEWIAHKNPYDGNPYEQVDDILVIGVRV